MNQNELEAEIRKVSQDSTLDPRRKAYLIQNLMTRFAPPIIQSYEPLVYIYVDIIASFILINLVVMPVAG